MNQVFQSPLDFIRVCINNPIRVMSDDTRCHSRESSESCSVVDEVIDQICSYCMTLRVLSTFYPSCEYE
jgi:hypothetical protein